MYKKVSSVLFICLGNICRSPVAEGIFNDLLERKNLTKMVKCDSAGTSSYHIGDKPDRRSVRNALENGVILSSRARQFETNDLRIFDYILTMDQSNYDEVLNYKGNEKCHLYKMRDFDTGFEGHDVPDPYYGGENGFQEVFEILERSCNNFLNQIILKDSAL